MSVVTRTNRSLKGMGCGTGCGCGPKDGMTGLGMDSYLTMGWTPPGQGTEGEFFGNTPNTRMTINQPGTTANALARSTPDGATPTGQAVVSAFSNNYGGAQPGELPLNPNERVNTLSFVQPVPMSLECQLTSAINSHPLIFIGACFGLFYLANVGGTKVRAYHAKRKAAKGAK